VRPVRQLVDFARIPVGSDAAAVRFEVPLQRLAYTWPDGRRGVERGDVTLLLGLSSADIRDTRTLDVPELVIEVPA
jgi:beta-glucosidase